VSACESRSVEATLLSIPVEGSSKASSQDRTCLFAPPNPLKTAVSMVFQFLNLPSDPRPFGFGCSLDVLACPIATEGSLRISVLDSPDVAFGNAIELGEPSRGLTVCRTPSDLVVAGLDVVGRIVKLGALAARTLPTVNDGALLEADRLNRDSCCCTIGFSSSCVKTGCDEP
jgi:hypothetical protein